MNIYTEDLVFMLACIVLFVVCMIKFREMYFSALRDYSNFEGKSSRKDFWGFAITDISIIMLIFSLFCIPYAFQNSDSSDDFYTICAFVIAIYRLATIVPLLAIEIRRYHDVGKKWYWLFVPVANIVLFFVKGKDSPEENPYTDEQPTPVSGATTPSPFGGFTESPQNRTYKPTAGDKPIVTLEGMVLYKGKQPIGFLKVYRDRIEFVHSGNNYAKSTLFAGAIGGMFSCFNLKETDVVDVYRMSDIVIANKSKHPKASSYVELVLKDGTTLKYLDRASIYTKEQIFTTVDTINKCLYMQ